MRDRLLLLVVGLAISLIVARHVAAASGVLSEVNFSALGYKIALAVFIVGTALVLFRERFMRAIVAAIVWLAMVLVLLVGYTYRFELHEAADRVLAELLPGRVISHGHTVAVARSGGGNFSLTARINGAPVAMVLDTGASLVVLTHDDAKAAGLPLEMLNYTATIDTANGRALAAPVTLDHVAVGSLIEHSVDALVARPGQLKESLLGMSFLNRLRSWKVSGDRLVLRGYR